MLQVFKYFLFFIYILNQIILETMLKYLIVFIGSGFGGALRFWLSSIIHKHFSTFFPIGTLAVNILGSFVLGYFIFGLDEKGLTSTTTKLLIAVGFCGGFTTFSTFSQETFNLLRNSEFFLAGLYIFLSVAITIFGVYLAYLVTK